MWAELPYPRGGTTAPAISRLVSRPRVFFRPPPFASLHQASMAAFRREMEIKRARRKQSCRWARFVLMSQHIPTRNSRPEAKTQYYYHLFWSSDSRTQHPFSSSSHRSSQHSKRRRLPCEVIFSSL